jgi:hypothetical protein
MSQARDSMIKALQAIVVPKLREQGFKGSFPHFRRPGEQKVDLLTFQFDNWGGGFVIEISRCPPEGITTSYGKYILPNKVTAWNTPSDQRHRLQPRRSSSTSDWFRYDHPTGSEDVFENTARQVLPFLREAEEWWKG